MKKRIFLSIISTFLLCCFFISCQHEVFLPNPNIDPGRGDSANAESKWQAPEKLVATQGAKRLIKLSWKPVKDAVRYNIYRAETEFDKFVQVGETKGPVNNFEIKMEPSSDVYYRVSAVDNLGKESDKSNIIRATTLAKPIINYIEGKPQSEDSDLYVSWYMNNNDAYVDDVTYNVICYDDKQKEVQSQISRGLDTRVLFTGLNPNTTYFFKVEAYNYDGDMEVSELVDTLTARNMRPEAVKDLVAEQGISKESIKLSFVLPNFVDVNVGKNLYEPVPLYFKIYRRLYKEGDTTTPFTLISNDFGKIGPDGKIKFDTVEGYVPGTTVTFTDNNSIIRGEKYEYKVQSFANIEREISSDESIAVTANPGWLLPVNDFEISGFTYFVEKEADKEVRKASLDFIFTPETLGIPYNYRIKESKRALASGSSYVESDLVLGNGKTTTNNVSDISKRIYEDIITADEGYYKYKLEILSEDETVVLDTLEAVGEILVTGKVLPKVENITVTYGYQDRVVLEWPYDVTTDKDYKYNLRCWDEGSVEEKNIVVTSPTEGTKITITDTVVQDNENSIKPGVTRYYQLVVQSGDLLVPSKLMKATIPTKPELSANYAYDKVSVVVSNPQSIDKNNYDVKATFEDNSLNANYELKRIDNSEKPVLFNDELVHLFEFNIVNKDPAVVQDFIDSKISGAKIKVDVVENHPLVTETYINKEETSQGETTDPVVPDGNKPQTVAVPTVDQSNTATEQLSNSLTTAYVGPALIGQVASEGTTTDSIKLTWNKVLGANTYVVFRDRYHLGKSDKKEDLELQNSISDKYIVTLNPDKTVSVTCEESELDNSELIKYVAVTYDSTKEEFTLEDKYREKTDTDAGNQWRIGQAEITWGAPNKYTVIPMLNVEDATSSYKDKAVVKINETNIGNISTVKGGTVGYGWNAVATKGTYTTDSKTAEKYNDAIRIDWKEPYFGKPSQYIVFRKPINGGDDSWIRKSTTDTYYVDKDVVQGEIYEYTIVNADYKEQIPDLNFVSSQKQGEAGKEAINLIGFVLPKPKIDAVSKGGLGVDKESVSFFTDPNINNMISGYAIQIRNNNIDNNWHTIKEVSITPENLNNTLFRETVESKDLLKILRDYKHYYRILAFAEYGSDRYYSKPDTATFIDGMDTEYVKWGTRDITIDEFAKAAIIGMSTGMEAEREDFGSGSDGNGITGLKSTSKFNWGPSDYTITFNYKNYEAKHTAKSGMKDVQAVKVNGTLYARGGSALAYQTHYWTSSPINVTYLGFPNIKGTIAFKGDTGKDSQNVSRYGGNIEVTWNGETKTYNMGNSEHKKLIGTLPFAYYGEGYLNNSEEWK